MAHPETCYLERSLVREILIGASDDDKHVAELFLMQIDALPIVTAQDLKIETKKP